MIWCTALTHDKDGKVRWTEELTSSKKYKMHYPDHQQYWQEIAAEIQCFGANTFATIFRGGKGVLYREVLTDVCDKLKVNYHEKSSVERIELALLSKILEDALNKMTQEQLKEIASELGVNNVEMMSKGALAAVIIKIFNFGGFYSYQLTVIIVNAILKALIGRGLSILSDATLVRILSTIVCNEIKLYYLPCILRADLIGKVTCDYCNKKQVAKMCHSVY